MVKKIIIVVSILAIVALGIGYYFLYGPNTTIDKYELLIRENTSYDVIKTELTDKAVLSNATTFDVVAGLMKYKKSEVPTGRYVIEKGMSNRSLITKLRSGDQDPIKLTFNSVRTIQELAGLLSKSISTDSLTLLNSFLNPVMLAEYGLNPQTAMTLFIPNTYEVFWNISPEKLIKRMKKENEDFWNNDRIKKAGALNLSKEQVYTLASIVEKESNNEKERPTIAGVYLNRLRIGDKLRADPTVVFAVGDFELRRVLFQHLNFDSPYNTYMYAGLPPGPIYMPSKSSIDAVLNYEVHEYFFFCAKPGYDSEHSFAKTAEQHQRNANIYHAWLTNEGIK